METATFDLDEWLAQAITGRGKLVNKKRELMKQRNDIDAEITKVDAAIAMINEVAGPVLGDNGGKRVTGVQELVRKVVCEMAMPNTDHPERSASRLWEESEVVEAVLGRDPMMKPTSIRSSLRTLVSKGEVERQGKRGSHTYRWSSENAEQPSMEDRVRNALANAGPDGVSEKDLAWKAGDSETTGTLLETLVEQGNIEKFPVGEGEFRYRIVPKAERQEEQKTLFGGAEQPPA